MKKAELVFIPTPVISHLLSTVEVAKLLLDRDERLSITFLIMKIRSDPKIDRFINSVSTACNRIRFIDLPKDEPDPNQPRKFLYSLIETQIPHVKDEVSKLVSQSESSPDSPTLSGFVLDMFCTPMMDVANEFGVPSYIFLTSGAASLGVQFYVQALHDEQKVDPTEFKGSDAELVMPCLANPVPAKVLPSVLLNKERQPNMLRQARRFRETKGIIINTFEELESHAIHSFSKGKTPPVYPVGPILNLNRDGDHDVESDKYKDIKQWLDDQPLSSVVYLCFGSMGSFGVDQVKEIAWGLEQSGHRFLWSLRQPPPEGKLEAPSDYTNPRDVLPEGFLDRTANTGKIIGWAPQTDILAHPSVGGFVSHCGWNSILESIWFGVPIAAWPLYAEQQLNAFQIIVELGLGVEIKMDYRREFISDGNETVISSGEIERGVRCLMELCDEKREKLKEMSEKSRKAVENGGTSFTWFFDLPEEEPDPNQPDNAFFSLIETQKPHAKEEVSKLVSQSESSPGSPALAGFVLDMFCTPMIDVTTEFGVPSYIFFTSGAAYLGLVFYIQALHAKVLPSLLLSQEGLASVLAQARRFRETKVGPILKQWVDDQPLSSVVYICFGSMGSFGVDQVKEIACGLEQSGHQFLWSLRQPPPKGGMELLASDYTNPRDVLPQGFF
ncbi:hypothetical protein POTOM_052271 [Populus tomentosa]|uniref:anthocyanidin 3-O-glucosyltransferase n=1 Tax=Populus tomentosa TaxID=118781 RepID=A0A8X8C740_POPTO|nr:hypothetical protein POTOM_052271 [Populus tomentosa]